MSHEFAAKHGKLEPTGPRINRHHPRLNRRPGLNELCSRCSIAQVACPFTVFLHGCPSPRADAGARDWPKRPAPAAVAGLRVSHSGCLSLTARALWVRSAREGARSKSPFRLAMNQRAVRHKVSGLMSRHFVPRGGEPSRCSRLALGILAPGIRAVVPDAWRCWEPRRWRVSRRRTAHASPLATGARLANHAAPKPWRHRVSA